MTEAVEQTEAGKKGWGRVEIVLVLAATLTALVLAWLVARGTVFGAEAGASAAQAPILVIDPEELLRIFVAERAGDLDGDDLKDAVRLFDALVERETYLVAAEHSTVIVKADLLFAGGQDVTRDFATRVLTLWDAEQ